MITISLQGSEEAYIYISKQLGGFNTGAMMQSIASTVEAQTKRRINSEKTSPGGAKWAPLKASTIARKGTDNILVDNGQLLGSISHIAQSHLAVVGTNVFYAPFHQDGTKKMPAREFIGLSAANQTEVEHIINTFVARQLG